ncbi:MAG: T9SS type A sorting domain-containing protein [Bacteroidetes bacterium]|nr:T9SS type A sorting domain-containing protein [Bacteroidota bacterium]
MKLVFPLIVFLLASFYTKAAGFKTEIVSTKIFCINELIPLTAKSNWPVTNFNWTIKDANGKTTKESTSDSTLLWGDTVIGKYTVELSVSNANSSLVIYDTIELIKPPIVLAGKYDSVCANASPFMLDRAFPKGTSGLWYYNGKELTGGMFNPASFGVGKYQLTYKYTVPGTNCMVKDDANIEVNAISNPEIHHTWPNTSGNANRICFSDELSMRGSKTEDGISYRDWEFNGAGVQDFGGRGFIFDASSAGAGSHKLTYTVENRFGCTNSITETVVVSPIYFPKLHVYAHKNRVYLNDTNHLVYDASWKVDGQTLTGANQYYDFKTRDSFNVTYTGNSEYSACPYKSYTFKVGNWPTSISETTKNLEVFPTLSNGIISISGLRLDQIETISVLNASGQVVEIEIQSTLNNQIDVSHLEEGVYWLLVSTKTEQYLGRFIKQP